MKLVLVLNALAMTFVYYNNASSTFQYYIKFSGIPSGKKSKKRYPASDDIIFIHTCVISFLTSQLAVFSHDVKHLWFSVVWSFGSFYIIKRILHGGLEIRNFSSHVEEYFCAHS